MILLQYDSDNLPYEKVGKNEPVCIADKVPFEIPDSWEWVRLKNLVKKEIRRGKSPKYTVSSNIQVFAQKCNVKTGGMKASRYANAWEGLRECEARSNPVSKKCSGKRLEKGLQECEARSNPISKK